MKNNVKKGVKNASNKPQRYAARPTAKAAKKPVKNRVKSAPKNPEEQHELHPEMNIQWFPGHMTRARRKIVEDIKLVDAVCEVVDARIPRSSANPDIGELTAPKPRLVILNRTDLADPAATKKWAAEYRRLGFGVLETDCKAGRGIDKFAAAARELCAEMIEKREGKGQSGKSLRLMVVGIPNVGKSSFINRVAGRRAATTSDRPGVTRGRQWISCRVSDPSGASKDTKSKLAPDADTARLRATAELRAARPATAGGSGATIELLDTPGILWPRFDDAQTGENLAITGAVKDDVLDIELLGSRLLLRLWTLYPERVIERYKLQPGDEPDEMEPLAIIAKRRGYLISGGEPDTRRAAIVLLDEFRGGKLGRLTLELPGED